MKIRIKTDAEADQYLNAMAREASLSVEDLAEIAVYNLIALWVAERKQVEATGIVPDSPYHELVYGEQPGGNDGDACLSITPPITSVL